MEPRGLPLHRDWSNEAIVLSKKTSAKFLERKKLSSTIGALKLLTKKTSPYT